MKKTILFTLAIFFTLVGKSQSLENLEDSIKQSFSGLADATSDDVKRVYADRMTTFFDQALNMPGAFEYPFEKLRMMKGTSSDGHVRIINWNLPYNDGTYKYYGFVMIRDPKTAEVSVVKLEDQEREIEKVETKFLNPDKWFGALYFEIIPIRKKKKEIADTYVLLGWDGKDNMTTRKVMDVLSITGNGKIRFGAGIFETPKGSQKRVVLEYSNEVSVSVKYYPKKKCIVMDHVSPKSPQLVGIFAEYGPDGTYDLFELEKGKWILKENIEVGQFSTDDDRPYNDPAKMR